MKKLIYITIFLATVVTYNKNTLYAQGIGINETGASPDPSAGLDVDFNNKGMLGPRLTTAQRNSISSPAIGLQIFNLDTDCIEVYFANGGWKAIECGCTSFPDATFPNPGGAANVPVNFDANTVVSTNTYNWIFDQGTPSSSADTGETVTWTTADTYEVTLTVSDENNCVSTHTENVVITPCSSFPDATFTGSNGSINSPIAFSANGSGAGYTYDWTFPSGTPSTSTQQNPSVEWATDGTYTVELTVTDNLSCSASETMEITVDLCTPDGPWNFTNASATGRFGPSQSQINTAYSGTNLDGDVTSNSGIQTWVVPTSGTYRIRAEGARGGISNGANQADRGPGAIIEADVVLNAGDQIELVVGQEANQNTSGNTANGGGRGGGGTFVWISGQSDPLIVAGGGGGGSIINTSLNTSFLPGKEGNTGTSGLPAYNNDPIFGTNGADAQSGWGGSGWNSMSASGNFNGITGSHGSISGFGGGGDNRDGSHAGGGGGGYSGGGGGNYGANTGSGNSDGRNGGGGGGSYVVSTASNVATSDGQFNSSTSFNGSPIQNLNSYNTGQGSVSIEKICP